MGPGSKFVFVGLSYGSGGWGTVTRGTKIWGLSGCHYYTGNWKEIRLGGSEGTDAEYEDGRVEVGR